MSVPAPADVGRRRRRLLGVGVLALGVVALVVASAAFLFGIIGPTSRDTPTTASPPPHFVEQAQAAGIDHIYDGEYEFFVGGGVAAFDCNDDGRADLYLAGGTQPAALYRNESPIGGELRFSQINDPATDLTSVTGAYPLDIDGDGILDLAVLRFGENVILRGTGDCHFERANEALGFDGGDVWTTAFSATWEAGASLPTLAYGNYLVDPQNPDPNDLCRDDVLVRPAADGTTYDPAIPLAPSWCTLSMLFSDWGRTGQRDLRVSNDREYYSDLSPGEEQLWRMTPGQAPTLYTEADGWRPVRIEGMGIASQDLDGDGRPEVFLSSQIDSKLQTLVAGASGPDYHDIALQMGTTVRRPYTGDDPKMSTAWHPEFQDVNNDGFMDLFITKGNVEAMPDLAAKDPSNLLIGQPSGPFVEGGEAAGIATFDRQRGAALVDLNLDGLLDIVSVTRRENVKLWRNVGAGTADAPAGMGHWVGLKLEQPGPNRDAVGAWIEVRVGDRVTQRELTVGGGHAGGQLGWTHFGLGPADRAEVRVQWPDGELGPWMPIPADGFAIVERGADAVRPWTPTGQ